MQSNNGVSNVLPFIRKSEVTMAPDGHIMQEKTLTIQGENLKECSTQFERMWKNKK